MVKNYIHFNENGKIKKQTIGDLYAGSHLVDAIYLFADFDISDSSVTLMFKRSDGQLIGEVDCLPDSAEHPVTGEIVNCFSFLIGSDVLGSSGPLQITARYYNDYVVEGITEQQVRATGMVTANVYETVPVYGGQNTVILNLNRKIASVRDDMNSHINNFNKHNHDTSYFKKEESNNLYGTSLEVDTAGNIILKNGNGTAISSVRMPLLVQTAQPGTLKFSGYGGFTFTTGKKYLISLVGSPILNLTIFHGVQPPGTNVEDVEYAHTYTSPIENITSNIVLELISVSNWYEDENLNCKVDVVYIIDGAHHDVTYTFIPDLQDFARYGLVKLGLHSTGYYQVYELEV